MEHIHVIHTRLGDATALLREVEVGSVDLVLTDPPYQINYEGHAWDQKSTLNWQWLSNVFYRLLKPNGMVVIFQGWSEVVRTMRAFEGDFHLKNWLIYDRIKGRGARHNFVSTREDILWYVKQTDQYTYHKIPSTILKRTGGSIGHKNGTPYRALSNVWTDISPIVPWSRERVKHPTQKPLDLMKRLVQVFSNEGDLILDPFMGSGTTGVACQALSRKFIGFEKDAAYYRLALERLEREGHKT